jgi:hypothetical protein
VRGARAATTTSSIEQSPISCSDTLGSGWEPHARARARVSLSE